MQIAHKIRSNLVIITNLKKNETKNPKVYTSPIQPLDTPLKIIK